MQTNTHKARHLYAGAKAWTQHILFIDERLITKSLWSWCAAKRISFKVLELKNSLWKCECVFFCQSGLMCVFYVYKLPSLVWGAYMPMRQKGEAAQGGGNQRLLIRNHDDLTASGGRLTPSFI